MPLPSAKGECLLDFKGKKVKLRFGVRQLSKIEDYLALVHARKTTAYSLGDLLAASFSINNLTALIMIGSEPMQDANGKKIDDKEAQKLIGSDLNYAAFEAWPVIRDCLRGVLGLPSLLGEDDDSGNE